MFHHNAIARITTNRLDVQEYGIRHVEMYHPCGSSPRSLLLLDEAAVASAARVPGLSDRTAAKGICGDGGGKPDSTLEDLLSVIRGIVHRMRAVFMRPCVT